MVEGRNSRFEWLNRENYEFGPSGTETSPKPRSRGFWFLQGILEDQTKTVMVLNVVFPTLC
jgi:hypothetical protein